MAEQNAPRLKNGGFAVSVAEDPILWKDRKRWLGLPVTFTSYSLTANKLFINTGLLNLREEEVRLYRIRDISLKQSLADRLFGVGSLLVQSSDASIPVVEIQKVKNPQKVKAVLSQCVEECRQKNGIRTSELIGGAPGGPRPDGPEGDDCPNCDDSPAIFPDLDQNGIDDRTE